MKKYIKVIAIFLLLTTLFLASCNNKPIYHPAGKPQGDDIAVMGTVDDSTPSGKKRVAITYDDGPHNVYTKKIVDELSKYGFKATFFVVGNRVDGTAYNGVAGITYAYEKGNEIGIHAYTHTEYYNKCSDDVYRYEIDNTAKAIKNVLGDIKINMMRPVGGAISSDRVETSEYSIILWNVDTEDWKYKYSSDDTESSAEEKVQAIVDNVMNQVSDGSIILMHDIYGSTYDATVIILEKLYAEGYEVVTVSELLGDSLSAGKKFSRKSE